MLTKCKICDNLYFWKRDHCPACSARRVLPASPEQSITHINSVSGSSLVRGLVSDYSFSVIYRSTK